LYKKQKKSSEISNGIDVIPTHTKTSIQISVTNISLPPSTDAITPTNPTPHNNFAYSTNQTLHIPVLSYFTVHFFSSHFLLCKPLIKPVSNTTILLTLMTLITLFSVKRKREDT